MAIKRTPLSEQQGKRKNDSAQHEAMEGRIVMGIDPGTNLLGYAVIQVLEGEPKPLVYGTIRPGKFEDPYQKLAHIFKRLTALIKEHKPDEMALESPFYGVNVQSMLKLGRAQGVAMAAALAQDIDVFEYAPTRVKQAIAGRGRASKEQVADILHTTLGIEVPKELDATDALSVALCHYYTQCSPFAAREKSGGSSSWKTYVNQNPDKISK